MCGVHMHSAGIESSSLEALVAYNGGFPENFWKMARSYFNQMRI